MSDSHAVTRTVDVARFSASVPTVPTVIYPSYYGTARVCRNADFLTVYISIYKGR